jgi:hypothetical protein
VNFPVVRGAEKFAPAKSAGHDPLATIILRFRKGTRATGGKVGQGHRNWPKE